MEVNFDSKTDKEEKKPNSKPIEWKGDLLVFHFDPASKEDKEPARMFPPKEKQEAIPVINMNVDG